MTKDAYFSMMKELNLEPKEEEIPPGIEDFPYLAEQAYIIFGKLSDSYIVTSEMVRYKGKDYSTLIDLCKIYGVDEEDYPLLLDLLNTIDAFAIKKANRKKPPA